MAKKDDMKYLSAFVMGDGGVYFSGNHCRYISNQIVDHQDYIYWRAAILGNFTEVTMRVIEDKRTDCNRKNLIRTWTHAHPIFTKLRNRIYVGNYKSVDPHYLKLLDWEMLAILFQDDGSTSVDTRCDATPQAKLNLKRLSYGDQLLLKKALKDRLGLEWNIHRHYNFWFLSLRTKDYDKMKTELKSIIYPSFQYKLP